MHSNYLKTKKNTLLLILSLIFMGAFHIATIRPGNDWGGDFGLYIEHAKNIVEGKNFVDTHYIYNPEMPFHPKNYPPVFPLLLAPVYKIFGLNLTVMKIEIVLLFILSLTVFFLLLKNEIPFYYLIILILVIGLNPFISDRKDHILSDIPFILLSYLFLFFLNKKYELKKHSFWLDLSIPFLLYLSYACRNMVRKRVT
ncbi:MAG: hypothetical protein HY072_00300 [Deltaproteobacteria bacterium]|nr:hypothetical protein [Deltaproteobacteria bacterium]